MRKFLVSVIIILVAAGAVFYFGWIQFQLPPNTYAVIFTKTSGFEHEVVKPGDFEWRWQRLLPTNLTLYTYTLEPQQTQINSSGTLPSGALYSRYLAGNPDFSYKVSISVSYLLRPESLPDLMINDKITPKSLDTWYSDFVRRCDAEAKRFIAAQTESANGVGLGLGALRPALMKDLSKTFPEVRFTSVTPETVTLPDLTLYRRAKQQYLAIAAAEQQVRQHAAVTKTNLDEVATQRIDMLKRFGALFNQYPVLLKYLDLDPAKRQGLIPGIGPAQSGR